MVRLSLPYLRNSSQIVLVLVLICSLSIHFLLRKVHLGQFIADDYLQMQRGLMWACSFTDETTPYTLLPRCLSQITNALYSTPILFLFSTFALVAVKFFLIFELFRNLKIDNRACSLTIVLLTAGLALTLITLGGASRFTLGSAMVLTKFDLSGRTWNYALILLGLVFYIKNRMLIAGLSHGAAVFLHTLNTFHVFAVLILALLISRREKKVCAVLAYALPVVVAIGLQNSAVSSFSSAMIDAIPGPVATISTQEWYRYIYSQDADDLSLIFHLGLGWLSAGYLGFCAIGLYLGWRLEKKSSFLEFISAPGIAISIAGLIYIAIFALIELFQYPSTLLEIAIQLQPRRAMYIPVLFLTYYWSRSLIDFILLTKERTNENFLVLLFSISALFLVLTLSSWKSVGFPAVHTLAVGLAILATLYLIYRFSSSLFSSKYSTQLPVLVLAGILFLVFVKTVPFLTGSGLNNIRTLYFSSVERTYTGYLLIDAKLHGSDSAAISYLELIEEVKSQRPDIEHILMLGFGEKERDDLIALTGAPASTTDIRTQFRQYVDYLPDFLPKLWPAVFSLTQLSLGQFIELGREGQVSALELGYLKEIRTQAGKGRPIKIKTLNGLNISHLITRENICNLLAPVSFTTYRNSRFCLHTLDSDWPSAFSLDHKN